MTTKTSRPAAIFILVGALLAVSGCTDKSSPGNVDTRSIERWNYLIEHKAEKAYDYLSPGYRETQPRETYAAAMNGRPVKWISAKFVGKECEEDHCKVRIDVTYSIPMPGLQGTTPVQATNTQEESWIRADGEWFYLPK